MLLIDAHKRILLFASEDDDGKRFWYPPGGGTEPGESAEQTARREIWEETGLQDVELAAEVWRRNVVVTWGGVTFESRERWFLANVANFDIDMSRFTELEQSSIVDHRWWPLTELATATDRLVPDNLHDLLERLLQEGPPEQPLNLRS